MAVVVAGAALTFLGRRRDIGSAVVVAAVAERGQTAEAAEMGE